MRISIPLRNMLLVTLLFCMGCVEDSIDIFRPSDLTRPERPAGLTATATSSTIHLSWNGITDDDLSGYNVYRATASDTMYARIASDLPDSIYTDTSSLAPDTSYYYAVTAEDGSGNESYPSNIVSISLNPDRHTLTIVTNNSAWGSTLPDIGDHIYTADSEVALTATPAQGYRFVSWAGPVADADSVITSVTVTDNMTVTANFESIPDIPITHTLTMQVNQSEWGGTTPAAGTHEYVENTPVAITATPAQGYRFVSWAGPVDNADSVKTSITITDDVIVTAQFEQILPDMVFLTMATSEEGGGATIPSAGAHSYQSGSKVTITAIPASGFRFVSWNGPVADKDSIATSITLTVDINVTATFEKVDYTLTIDAYRNGWGTTSPETGIHTYKAFSEVTLTATPAQGYRFERWTGNVKNPDSASTSIVLTQNETATAIFEEIPPNSFTLTVGVNETGWGTTTPSIGQHIYQDGSLVNITAVPEEGYKFVNWSGPVTDSAKRTTTVAMDGDVTVTANFENITYTLTLDAYQNGWGTTTPSLGSHQYDINTEVPVTATPSEGYRFVRWTGNVKEPNSVSTMVTVTQNETVTAIFEEIPADMFVLTMKNDHSDWGTLSPQSGTHIYEDGAIVSLTATPNYGYTFVQWEGDVDNPDSTMTSITITGNTTVTAVFEPLVYMLSITVDPEESGTTMPAVGDYYYNYGTEVQATAAPVAGKQFVNWTGPVNTPNAATTTLTINGNMSITANFEPVTHTLTTTVLPLGGGTTTPSIGEYTYDEGTVVDISATPATGYRFESWTGGVAEPSNATTTVTVTGNITATANFIQQHTLTLAVETPDQGTISPIAGDHTYDHGTTVPLVATAADSFQFKAWTGDIEYVDDPSNASTVVSVDNDLSLTATFEKITYSLTMTASNPAEGGTTTPAASTADYDIGTEVQIIAVPAAGYRFNGWTGDVADANNDTTTVTIDGAKTVTANFMQQHTLTMVVDNTDEGTTSPVIGGHLYDHDEEVSITATPKAGFQFDNWTGSVDDPNSASTSVIVTGDITVTANFVPEYTLTMAAEPEGKGTTTPAVGSHIYKEGAEVTITATPEEGQQFVNWTGAAVTDANASETTVIVNGDITVTANFEPVLVTYTLTMAVDTPGNGTTDPAIGAHDYAENDEVTITATPAEGYRFDSWAGDVGDANSATTTITIDSDKTVTANFVLQHTLTMAVGVADEGTTSPAIGDHIYDHDESVPITATPAEGFIFDSWTGAVDDQNSATTSVTVNSDITVTANFVPEYTLSMAVNAPGSGTTDPIIGDHDYAENEEVTITATPAEGYRFDSWTGDVDNTNSATTTVTVDSDKTVTANFVQQHTLTMVVGVADQGTTSPVIGDHVYDHNESVPITATPAEGFIFDSWTGAVDDPNSATTSVTVSDDITVTANFVPEYTLTMAVDTPGNGTTDPAVGDHDYAENDEITITATPAEGYRFDSWTGDVADVNSATTTVTIDGDKTVTANFVQQHTLTMAVGVADQGTTAPAIGEHTYDHDEEVTITATPAEGFQFVNWTTDVGSVTGPAALETTVTVNSDMTVTANFEAIP